MPEPTEGPWVAAPVIKGFPQHPGEVRGPNGPICYVSLAVPIEQRHATVSVLAAGLEMQAALQSIGMDENIDLSEGVVMVSIQTMKTIHAALAKAKGETPNA